VRQQLENEKKTAIDGIEALRKTLAERDQALLDQSEQQRTTLEAEQLAREHAEQTWRESLCRVQEEHRSTEASRSQLQDQCLEMAAAVEKLKCEHQLQLEAEQTKQAELRQRATDNDALRAEVDRLRDENRGLHSHQLTSTQLAAELQRRDAELASARHALEQLCAEKQTAIDEIETLQKTLAERDQALRNQTDQHRTALEGEQLAREHAERTWIDEVEVLRKTLTERDQALLNQTDQHRTALEREQLAREHAERTWIDEVEALRKTLAERDQALLDQSDQHCNALAAERLARQHAEETWRESLCRLQEEHQSAETSRKHFEERCLEMAAALEKLKCDHQLQLEAEHTKQKALADELVQLKADSEETSRLAGQLIAMKMPPPEPNRAPDLDLQAIRLQVDELTHWLELSERANREMIEILRGIGIQVDVPAELEMARSHR
jgi:ribosomal protein L19E